MASQTDNELDTPRFDARVTALCETAELSSGRCNDFAFPMHTHAEYTIGLVTSGLEKICYKGGSSMAGPGSVYFHEPDEAHTGISVDRSAWQFHSMYLDKAFFERHLNIDPPRFNEAVSEDKKSADALNTLAKVLDCSACDVERMSALKVTVQALVERNATSVAKQNRARNHGQSILHAKDYIHAYFDQPIKLDDMAKIAGLNPGYFIDSFRRSTGMTPHAYLTSVRLGNAKRMLSAGRAPAETAVGSGFYDQSHLNRHFNRVFGISAKRFQRQILTN